jgi:hypothetical protein
VLAAMQYRYGDKSLLPRYLAGSVFLFGFVLLGVAISHWHFE